ncbi:uncharacterized protein LOC132561742 [Ylistrum balloti]|uniref:uncharacterized protein LOC132561742 n=1 Tax=Ylistrum balloti TaxID=509963 RepID=UPI002905BD98|nr:uncharacterized protein LOC132561742 [Ylistrum balloti]
MVLGSVDAVVLGSFDVVVLGSVDAVVLGSVNAMVLGSVDAVVLGSFDVVVLGSVDTVVLGSVNAVVLGFVDAVVLGFVDAVVLGSVDAVVLECDSEHVDQKRHQNSGFTRNSRHRSIRHRQNPHLNHRHQSPAHHPGHHDRTDRTPKLPKTSGKDRQTQHRRSDQKHLSAFHQIESSATLQLAKEKNSPHHKSKLSSHPKTPSRTSKQNHGTDYQHNSKSPRTDENKMQRHPPFRYSRRREYRRRYGYGQRAPASVSRLEQRMRPKLSVAIHNLKHTMSNMLEIMQKKVEKVGERFANINTDARHDITEVKTQLKVIHDENNRAYDALLDVTQLVRFVHLRAYERRVAPVSMSLLPDMQFKDFSYEVVLADQRQNRARTMHMVLERIKSRCMEQEQKYSSIVQRYNSRDARALFVDIARFRRKIETRLYGQIRGDVRQRIHTYQRYLNTVTDQYMDARNFSFTANKEIRAVQRDVQRNIALRNAYLERRLPHTEIVYQTTAPITNMDDIDQVALKSYQKARQLGRTVESMARTIIPILQKAKRFIEERKETGSNVRLQLFAIVGRLAGTIVNLDKTMDQLRVLLADETILRERCEDLVTGSGGGDDDDMVIDCEQYITILGSGEDDLITARVTTPRPSPSSTLVPHYKSTTPRPSTKVHSTPKPKTTTLRPTTPRPSTTKSSTPKAKTTTLLPTTPSPTTTVTPTPKPKTTTSRPTTPRPSTTKSSTPKPKTTTPRPTTPSLTTTVKSTPKPKTTTPLPTTPSPTTTLTSTPKPKPTTPLPTTPSPTTTVTSTPQPRTTRHLKTSTTTTSTTTTTTPVPSTTTTTTPVPSTTTTTTPVPSTTTTTTPVPSTTTTTTPVPSTTTTTTPVPSTTTTTTPVPSTTTTTTPVPSTTTLSKKPRYPVSLSTTTKTVTVSSDDEDIIFSGDEMFYPTTDKLSTTVLQSKSPVTTSSPHTTTTTSIPTTLESKPTTAAPTTTTEAVTTTEIGATIEIGSGKEESDFTIEESKENEDSDGGWGGWLWGGDDPNVGAYENSFRNKLQKRAEEEREKSDDLIARSIPINRRHDLILERWGTVKENVAIMRDFVNNVTEVEAIWMDAEPNIESTHDKIVKLNAKINQHDISIRNRIEKAKKIAISQVKKAESSLNGQETSPSRRHVEMMTDLLVKADTVRSNMQQIKEITGRPDVQPCLTVQREATNLRNNITELRKKIDRARAIFSALPVSIAMVEGREYNADVPSTSEIVSPMTSLEVCIKPERSGMTVASFHGNGTVAYDIELVENIPTVSITGADGELYGTLQSSVIIEMSQWYNLHVTRSGHTVAMRTTRLVNDTEPILETAAFPNMQVLQRAPTSIQLGSSNPPGLGNTDTLGCIGRVIINGQAVGLAHAGSIEQPAKTCTSGCASSTAPSMVFDGDGYVMFPISVLRPNSRVDSLYLKFSTRQREGILLLLNDKVEQHLQMLLSVSEGFIHMEARTKRGTTVLRSNENIYADGLFHIVEVNVQTEIEATLDGVPGTFSQETSTQEIPTRIDEGIYVGGLGSKSHIIAGKTKLRSLTGCISTLRITDKTVPMYMLQESKNVVYGSCTDSVWHHCVRFTDNSVPVTLGDNLESSRVFITVSTAAIGTVVNYKRKDKFNINIELDDSGVTITESIVGNEEKLFTTSNNEDRWMTLLIEDLTDKVKVTLNGTSVTLQHKQKGWFATGDDSSSVYQITIGGEEGDDLATFDGGIARVIVNDVLKDLASSADVHNLLGCEKLIPELPEMEKDMKPVC